MNNFTYSIFLSFFNKMNEYITAVFPSLMESFAWFGRGFVTLYIVCFGILLIRGGGGKKGKEILVSVILLPLLWFWIMETRYYYNWFVTGFVEATMHTSSFFISAANSKGALGPSGLEGLFRGLDSLAVQIFDYLFKMKPPGISWATNAWEYMQFGTLMVALLISYCAAHILFLILFVTGFFSIYALLAVGGIFLFLAIFKETRFLFFAWIRALFNYLLTVVFTGIVMSICYFGVNETLNDLLALRGADGLMSPQYVAVLVWSIITFVVLLKATEYAAALSGGQPSSSNTAAGAVAFLSGTGVTMGAKYFKKALGLSNPDGRAGGILSSGGRAAMQGARSAYSALRGVNNKA